MKTYRSKIELMKTIAMTCVTNKWCKIAMNEWTLNTDQVQK